MDLERLFADVAHAMEAELVASSRLDGGSSANVWRLDLRSGSTSWPVVFRQHQTGELKNHDADVAAKEYRLLSELHALDFPVAEPLYLDQTNQLLVTEFVAGDSLVEPDAVGSAIEQMADLLVRIHSVDVALLHGAGLTPLEDPVERLPACLPSTPQGEQLGSLLETAQVPLHRNPAVLMHGDYWPGNVLWANGTLAALIDWEDACLGDPLADLACARVELLCQYGRKSMHEFTARYLDQKSPLDTRSLPLWECYVSATALASMHLWGLATAEEQRRRQLTEAFFNDAVVHISSEQTQR